MRIVGPRYERRKISREEKDRLFEEEKKVPLDLKGPRDQWEHLAWILALAAFGGLWLFLSRLQVLSEKISDLLIFGIVSLLILMILCFRRYSFWVGKIEEWQKKQGEQEAKDGIKNE